MLSLLDDGPPPAKPPVAGATRWAGQLVTLNWVVKNKKALKAYDRMPALDTACLDDGSNYTEHILSVEDWEVAEQLVRPTAPLPLSHTHAFAPTHATNVLY